MVSHPMYTLDVFAEERYAGNQLAVFRKAADLSTETMQKIAREMNYSETTFILSDTPREGGYDARIFTPEEELPFAGHPTLGTAYVILNEIMDTPGTQVKLNLKVGQIPVSVQPDGVLWMDQKPPVFGRTFEAAEVARVLGLDACDLDPRFPVQEVSTGLPFVIAALQSNGALRRAKRNIAAFEAFSKTHGRDMIYLFSAEPRSTENQLSARMFTIFQTMPEDPATGSACGCLGGYLVEHRYFGGDTVDVRVEQGYEIDRPSLLRLKASRTPGHIAVQVGGKVIMVSKGQLL
ncbi:PhzF family phenazine biosynthesis protein [Methanocella sp. MCL-LM]|uniref:PhzF family phenazine biosynthesis protein n=1 Tax=Methanocella sp. MCL-LM TaxID=3412035 RepID=UPI003C758003